MVMAYRRPGATPRSSTRRKAGDREARRLAVFAVLGGVLQMLFIRWADRSLGSELRLWTEGGLFVLYMVVIVVLLRRLLRGQRVVPGGEHGLSSGPETQHTNHGPTVRRTD